MKHLYRVTWQQAEYPNEEGDQLVELTADEERKLRKMGNEATKGTEPLLMYFELLPAEPMIYEDFIKLYGSDFEDAS